MIQSRKHGARYSKELLNPIANMLAGCSNIIDPFGGTGERLAEIAERVGCKAIGVEIQPNFIVRGDIVQQGDATSLLFPDCTFDGAVSSPTYGQRTNDNYGGCEGWNYSTYTAWNGGPLHRNNTGKVKFANSQYKQLHIEAWMELYRVLKPGSPFVLNIKDSWQGSNIVPVSQWHYVTLRSIGFIPVRVERVACPGMRNGSNRDKRIGKENLILFRK